MADCPFSLFANVKDLTPGEQADLADRPPSVLDGVGLTFYADLYRALAAVLSPAEADECELWQLGALLGVDRKQESSDPIDRLAAEIEAKKESLARRAGVKPELEGDRPAMVDVTAQTMRDMGIVTR